MISEKCKIRHEGRGKGVKCKKKTKEREGGGGGGSKVPEKRWKIIFEHSSLCLSLYHLASTDTRKILHICFNYMFSAIEVFDKPMMSATRMWLYKISVTLIKTHSSRWDIIIFTIFLWWLISVVLYLFFTSLILFCFYFFRYYTICPNFFSFQLSRILFIWRVWQVLLDY